MATEAGLPAAKSNNAGTESLAGEKMPTTPDARLSTDPGAGPRTSSLDEPFGTLPETVVFRNSALSRETCREPIGACSGGGSLRSLFPPLETLECRIRLSPIHVVDEILRSIESERRQYTTHSVPDVPTQATN